MTTTATAKQESYIISLYNQQYGKSVSYLSQALKGMGRSNPVGGLKKADASRIIDELKAR